MVSDAAQLPLDSYTVPFQSKTVLTQGPSEIINEKGLGFLCRKNDDLDLAKTILLASKSSPDKNKLLLRSKDFSIENIGAQYEDLLEEISAK